MEHPTPDISPNLDIDIHLDALQLAADLSVPKTLRPNITDEYNRQEGKIYTQKLIMATKARKRPKQLLIQTRTWGHLENCQV